VKPVRGLHPDPPPLKGREKDGRAAFAASVGPVGFSAGAAFRLDSKRGGDFAGKGEGGDSAGDDGKTTVDSTVSRGKGDPECGALPT
jgi:hypothetical protein